MTDDELRATAERLLKYAQVANKGQPWDATVAHKAVYHRTGFTRIEDETALAAAYLAEHKADDGELATPDWCRSVGLVYFHDGRAKVRWLDYPSGVDVLVGETVALRLPTRGQVRRLCAVLGVPLTEGAK